MLILPENPVSLAALTPKSTILMDAQLAWYMDWATDRLANVHAYADYFGHGLPSPGIASTTVMPGGTSFRASSTFSFQFSVAAFPPNKAANAANKAIGGKAQSCAL